MQYGSRARAHESPQLLNTAAGSAPNEKLAFFVGVMPRPHAMRGSVAVQAPHIRHFIYHVMAFAQQAPVPVLPCTTASLRCSQTLTLQPSTTDRVQSVAVTCFVFRSFYSISYFWL